MRKYITLLLIGLLALPLIAKEPVGYYFTANDKKGEALKTALHEIVVKANVLKYGGGAGYTWEGFYSTDRIDSSNKVWDMYSNETFYQKSFSSVVGMHIEHSLPKSWWGAIENNAYKDLFHLYPAEGNINIRKSNLPLGVVAPNAYTNGVSFIGANTFGDTYSGNCFEPADEYKGDFARSYLYVVTAYENLANKWDSPMMDNNTYPVWKKWAIDLLLKWHREDPVSEKELERIEQVYKIQGNRNPYIDYPDLVEHIWGNAINIPYKFPEETRPIVASPSRWDLIDFGVVILNSDAEKNVKILGSHLTIPLNVKVTGRYPDMISASTNSISANDVNNGTTIKLNLKAGSKSVVSDTLKLYSSEIDTVKVPISAIVSKEFMAINPDDLAATSATLKWMNISKGNDYSLSLYKGEADVAGDLLISVYLEGVSNNKALELYNATGRTVDLSDYSIKIQANGNGEFAGETPLSGMLGNNQSYIIVNKGLFGDADPGLTDIADMLTPLNFNGNDAVALYHNNMQIDVVGIVGGVNDWGKDITLLRKSRNPEIRFDFNDWRQFESDYYQVLKAYRYIQPSTPAVKIGDYKTAANKFEVQDLNPAQKYYYTVSYDGAESVNKLHFTTMPLAVPEVLGAINIKGTEFQANWEDVSGAKSYRFELSEMQGPGFTTEITDFTGVGTSGTPLPSGWTGTASGNYTTAASYGIASPSIAFKNNGEYIMTKSFAYPIVSLTFMYRFPSSGANNKILIEGFSTDKWVKIDEIEFINTSKYYPLYQFTNDDNISAIRITFNKSSGNLSIDDVEIKSGYETAVSTEYDVDGLQYNASGLKKLTRYNYRVKAIHPTYESEYSAPISVTTTNEDPGSVIEIDNDLTLNISVNNGRIRIESSQFNIDNISLYSISGQKVYGKKSNSTIEEIEPSYKGAYILDVEVANKHKCVKIIL